MISKPGHLSEYDVMNHDVKNYYDVINHENCDVISITISENKFKKRLIVLI